jgi:hypothetical protein
MFAPITKVNEGESNTPCPSTLEVTYSSVEKLSKTLVFSTHTRPHAAENVYSPDPGRHQQKRARPIPGVCYLTQSRYAGCVHLTCIPTQHEQETSQRTRFRTI